MIQSGVPAKFSVPWANSAGGTYRRAIPVASQIGVTTGAASLTDGFPPANFTATGAGGVPPFGADMNGILNQITAWQQWNQAGGPIQYDAAFQAAIGGYPLNAIVFSAITAGRQWMSTVDGNVTNPDTGGLGWVSISTSAASSITANGWRKYADGGISQWGTAYVTWTGSSFANGSFSFPTPFLNNCFGVTATGKNNQSGNPLTTGSNLTAISYNETLTGFSIRMDTNNGTTLSGTYAVSWKCEGN